MTHSGAILVPKLSEDNLEDPKEFPWIRRVPSLIVSTDVVAFNLRPRESGASR